PCSEFVADGLRRAELLECLRGKPHANGYGCVLCLKFFHRMASVDLDGPWTDPEAPGDELVGQSFAEQCQNLPLALAEAFQAFAGILDLAVPSPLPLRFGNGRRQALLEVAGHDRNFEVVECPAGEG